MSELVRMHEVGLIVFLGVVLAVALSNLFLLRRLGQYPLPGRFPRVSILVPVRNEEENIEACLRSLLGQDYPDFEVLALDDDSSDRTGAIMAGLSAADGRLRVLQGRPLPPGWLGKHWACHQLAQAADGELLLFTDADTRHHRLALRDAVAAMIAVEADFLAVLPQEEVVSWGERLIVPVLLWAFISFVPLALATRLRAPIFSAAIGQYMLLRRSAYEQVGGYAAVRQNVVDDLALGRRFKAQGRRWFPVDGRARVRCRMYRNLGQTVDGFSKNLFAAFDYRLLPFLFIWTWMMIVTWQPLLVLALKATGVLSSAFSPVLAAVALLLSLFLWALVCVRFGFPLYLALLHPISILLMAFIAVRSVVWSLSGRTSWSGRKLIRPRVRWL